MPQNNRKGKKNGPRTQCAPGCGLVSHCPTCDPHKGIGMRFVSSTQRRAQCKNGHVWNLRYGNQAGGEVLNESNL